MSGSRATVRPVLSLSWASLAVVLCAVPVLAAIPCAHAQVSNASAVRRYYLNDLVHGKSYTPGKNSFLVQKMHRGDKKTLLEIGGSGSVRHIWSTWSIPGSDSDVPVPRRVLMRVFVDGEVQPSISSPLDELCHAAEATGTRVVPLPAFNYKGAFNFYLPIFFNRGIRIEIEAADDIEEFYAQVDYRSQSQRRPRSKLVGEWNGSSVRLRYLGRQPSWISDSSSADAPAPKSKDLDVSAAGSELLIPGPGILRQLRFEGSSLEDLRLQMYWDDHTTADVDSPLRYFFADFSNAAMESSPGQSTCYFPMPFRKHARILLRSLSGNAARVRISYSLDPTPVPVNALYFHARYSETQNTLGYEQHSVLQAKGDGLFVGLNLFDSGHNHGGGDAALIDSGTGHPRVLHGICGEDYFGFAWHHFGSMTPLTGAPAHKRRYRLHLENPYPFHESIQFLFGVFANQHPRSVAFWYQAGNRQPDSQWLTFDIPWKILGPADVNTSFPDRVTPLTISTTALINAPIHVDERWQDATMRSGFLDTTYQFRHYTMTERGTGFVAGTGKTRLITWVYSPSGHTVKTSVGHDDSVSMSVNTRQLADVPGRTGFGSTLFDLPLNAGWNKLMLTLYNDENVNWRWCGLSLAFEAVEARNLRFAAQPEPNLASESGSVHAF